MPPAMGFAASVMNAKVQPTRMSYEEYLVFSESADVKHEYVNGEIWAMAGGSIDHSGVAQQLGTLLNVALRGRPCRVLTSDARIRVQATRANFYPDLSIVCGKAETPPEDPHSIVNPTVLVEVLSPNTGLYDRGAKASHYRRLSSLREYVMVSPEDRTVEVQRLSERGTWEIHTFDPGQDLVLESLGVRVPVAEIFVDPLADAAG